MEYPEVDVCPGEPHFPNEFLILNCSKQLSAAFYSRVVDV